MTTMLGLTLAAGLLLLLSPWLWVRGAGATRVAAPGHIARVLAAAGYSHATPSHVVVVSMIVAAVAGAVVWLLTALPAFAAVSAVAGAVAPITWLRGRARRLQKSRRALWPDVCDLLVASVRAGMSLPDAVGALGEVGPAALRPAFTAFATDVSASGHFDSGALRLKARLSDPVADRIIEALRMARQVGGTELTSVLRALSSSVRAEAALRAEIEARQSWIRGAAVLGVVAPWVILAMLALRPEGAAAYATPEGGAVILIGAGISAVAFRLMVGLGRLPEPRRWFA
ncbi:type II secretion system F family protein [Microbacterium dauci]|uniref:Type II secretion system F family protein n=1 Tax=Microbacterium dauci TaxID=3048008 RepID=A0ABT6ZBL0_9MICO|nr:type II secretion system F family protein [Microbacterium sp. LX3-4]MDJ1113540.1 type II secretion system F family protein [Microbacterium sp. LX3-4]